MPRPSNSSNFDEDIAERRVSDVLATTLLMVAALCLLGAIVIQCYECYQYRVPGTTTLLADSSGKGGAAEINANNLKADLVRTCAQIEAAYKRGFEEKPKKGHIDGTNFVAEEPMDLSDEMKEAVEQLCKDYGYGYKIFAPVLKARESSGASQAKPEEAAEEEPAAEEPAKEAAEEEPAAEEPAKEAAEEEPAAEEPAKEAAEEEPAAEEPAKEAAEEPEGASEDTPMEEEETK